jgi:hypothetical protein
MISGKEQDKGQDLLVSVYNEDNGLSEDLRAGRGTPVSTVIERMYEKFRLERQPDDRLRCEGTGEDVFAYAGMHLGDYLEAGHCPDLRWTFAGGTGGA